jgi:methanogenic corrinoid protein MtbC1
MNINKATASTLESNASDIAATACSSLLSADTGIDERFGTEAHEVWHHHLRQRLLELAIALAANDQKLFTAGLAWSRTAMQARGFSADDLELGLAALRMAVANNTSADEQTTAVEFMDQALQAASSETNLGMESQLDAGSPLDVLALEYVQTVVAGNSRQGIELVLDAVKNGNSIKDTYLKVLLPAQQEVGRLWHLNQLSVAEEHLVSYTTQRLMAMLSGHANFKDDNGFTAMAGAVAGNVHDIGIRAISYLLETEGWRMIYLGSDIPREELPNAVDAFKPDVLLLSIALTSQLSATKRVIANIREKAEHPVKILVGGNGLMQSHSLWKETGADGYAATADEALQLSYQMAANNS